ncbi:hypothetical protein FSP39_014876 [Pinctada imbricata]|uniref:Carbohydrate sulfotransferase n=1 Tax=Pinctada imbricata TaxID=66713 RepID=A0AA89C3K1_PINIB|nr:hypothetical protein FSP39_014876 [Pinctada imbricata]
MIKVFRATKPIHLVLFSLGFFTMYVIQRARSPIIIVEEISDGQVKQVNYIHNPQQLHGRSVGRAAPRRPGQPVFTKISDLKRYEISGSAKHGFSYCLVYKAATTSWLRIIRFLNGESSEVRSPYDVGKHRVHYYKIGKYIKYFNWKKDQKFLENSYRVMAVRDPYTRLWSAYIDKFLLPDFWKTRGQSVIRLVRKGRIDPTSARCGNDVTFKEFIDYVVLQDGAMKAWDQDKHWLPASAMCRQDIFQPHVVMKQENLSKDVPAVLTKLNLTWVLDRMTKINMTEFEMNDQIQYVYKIGGQKCANQQKLAELVWKAFQFNAYIPSDIPFPKEKFKGKFDANGVLKVLKEVRLNWSVTKQERKKQKRDALVAAYKTVPMETLHKLREIYMDDFKTFDYDPSPSDIFS